jgi:hypothetical protein
MMAISQLSIYRFARCRLMPGMQADFPHSEVMLVLRALEFLDLGQAGKRACASDIL